MGVPVIKRPAIFLDRDGVLNRDFNYVHRIEDLELLPQVSESLTALKNAGFLLIVVSNQSGVARGKFTLADVEAFNQALIRKVMDEGGPQIDAVYVCPHHRGGSVKTYAVDCECRKPKPGLLLRAAHEHNVDLTASIMVGDKVSDISAGKAAGLTKLFLVNSEQYNQSSTSADRVQDLWDAVQHITTS